MAKLKGPLRITGKVGDLSLYEMGGQIIVRRGWGPDKKRMRTDPAFERSWENSTEFGNCAGDCKLMRAALVPFVREACDSRFTSRLTSVLTALGKMDPYSPRGKRRAAIGIHQPGADQKLSGLNFNTNAPLNQVLRRAWQVDLGAGTFRIKDLKPKRDIVYPKGASHCRVQGVLIRVDLDSKQFTIKETNVLMLDKTGQEQDLALKSTGTPSGPGKDLFVLRLSFYQQVNGELYAFNDKKQNACALIASGDALDKRPETNVLNEQSDEHLKTVSSEVFAGFEIASAHLEQAEQDLAFQSLLKPANKSKPSQHPIPEHFP